MGQYYNALTERGGEIKSYDIRVEGGAYHGIKLLEHSYWDNEFMKAMTADIYHNKTRVAWVGDYADYYKFNRAEAPDPKTLFKYAWGMFMIEPIRKQELSLDGKFLVNHTKKLYVDCTKYYALNKYEWRHGQFECIHPLSLLTACGNGLGGGDYRNIYPDFESVGSWCWDEISVEDEAPKDYEETMYKFIEKKQLD